MWLALYHWAASMKKLIWGKRDEGLFQKTLLCRLGDNLIRVKLRASHSSQLKTVREALEERENECKLETEWMKWESDKGEKGIGKREQVRERVRLWVSEWEGVWYKQERVRVRKWRQMWVQGLRFEQECDCVCEIERKKKQGMIRSKEWEWNKEGEKGRKK